jgi:hypothetical protein
MGRRFGQEAIWHPTDTLAPVELMLPAPRLANPFCKVCPYYKGLHLGANRRNDRPQKITFGDLRDQGVRGILLQMPFGPEVRPRCPHSISINPSRAT